MLNMNGFPLLLIGLSAIFVVVVRFFSREDHPTLRGTLTTPLMAYCAHAHARHTSGWLAICDV